MAVSDSLGGCLVVVKEEEDAWLVGGFLSFVFATVSCCCDPSPVCLSVITRRVTKVMTEIVTVGAYESYGP